MKKLNVLFVLAVSVLLLSRMNTMAAATTNPPSNLAVLTVSGQCRQLRLTWNDNSTFSPEEWRVERALNSGGPWGQIAAFAGSTATTQAYTDPTVDDKTTYWYQVRWASNNVRFSTYSNIASNNTQVICAPTGLTVSKVVSSCTQLKLAWTDNSVVETEYRIERTGPAGTCASAFSPLATVPANSTMYTDTSVTATNYAYRVRAYRLSDNSFSAYSNCATNKPTACGSTVFNRDISPPAQGPANELRAENRPVGSPAL
jgi:hypothetical protein